MAGYDIRVDSDSLQAAVQLLSIIQIGKKRIIYRLDAQGPVAVVIQKDRRFRGKLRTG